MRSLYVSDDLFVQNFAALELDATGPRRKLVRYVLARLEADASHRDVDPDTDSGTIEHILPQNPDVSWDEVFPPDQAQRAVHRLGNLTLLEPGQNRTLAQQGYETKVATYAASRYAITQQLVELAPHEWNPALLDKRQRALATRAAQLWRLVYA